MDKLKKKLISYKKLSEEFATYFNKFSETIGSYHYEDIKKCRADLDKYSEGVDALIRILKIKYPEGAFKLLDKMADIGLVISDIMRWFEHFKPGKHRFSLDFSTTYMMDTSDMFDRVILLTSQTLKKHASYDSDIIEYLGSQLMESFSPHSAVEFFQSMQKCYYGCLKSVSLYAYVAQEIVNKTFADRETRISGYKILEMLEADKSKALADYGHNKKFTGDSSGPPLLSFGLIPVSDLMGANEVIMKVFDGVSDGGSESDADLLDAIGRANKVGIVVYRKFTSSQADYSVRGLLEKSNISSDSGLNLRLVNKFSTIKLGPSKMQPEFRITLRGAPLDDCSRVLIIDELSPGMYKIMSPWNSSSFLSPPYEVSDFLEFSKKGVMDVPTRSENYNAISISQMTRVMFLNRAVNVKQISEQSQVNEIKFLRHDLYTKIMEHYNSVIDKQYKGGENIKCNKDLISIINDSNMKDVFGRILIKSYHTFLQKQDLIGEFSHFVFNEVISTFLAQLTMITRSFVREIFTNSELRTPDESVYKKPMVAMITEIKDVIDGVLKDSLAKTLSDKSNVYQSLVYKMMLLNSIS